MKYLIVGIGNIGQEYVNTRHNIGFDTLDAFAEASNVVFEPGRFGDMAKYKFKGRTLLLLKPSTYVNLSGKAVRYWLDKENISQDNLLVIVDDLALPLASLRLRSKGSDAGHNGLKSIQQLIGVNYARLRFGIGNDYPKGQQADFVLGQWNEEEKKPVADSIAIAQEIVKSFVTIGVARTMNQFNKKWIPKVEEVRIDKFLWAVRLYKTRTLAAGECEKGRVKIGGASIKPSRMVRVGDVVYVTKPPVTYSYKVLLLADKRMGAPLVVNHIKDITTEEQIEVLEMHKLNYALGRKKGTGRPTKRERRAIDKLMDWDD